MKVIKMMKHADLIRAALDGKTIQWRYLDREWKVFADAAEAIKCLAWPLGGCEYRLEPPPPPPDVVTYDFIRPGSRSLQQIRISCTGVYEGSTIVKLTINGETGAKTVEIVPEGNAK